MELAIPLLALGGLFIVSNQKNKQQGNQGNQTNQGQQIRQGANLYGPQTQQEAYENMGKNLNTLPNTDTPPQNYPFQNIQQLGLHFQ